MGLAGVTVMLSGMADGQTTTDDSGQFSFTGLRAGTYSVEISGFDTNEVSFSSTSGAATVGVGESKVVSFDGTYLRTAGIQGQVSVDGEGLGGVTVTLVGEGEERTDVTDAGGLYAFSLLKSGTYQVAITNPDPEDYEFTTTSKSQTIATGEIANVPFEGTLLRTAGIAGRVSLDDGMGLDGVTVTLAGAAEATTETSNGGQYSFAGLAAGTYVLTIENPNETAYNFAEDEMQKTVMLEDDQSAIVNFSGTHTRTASVSGMLFVDEVMQDKMYTEGEPSITAALAPWLASLADDDPAQMAVAGLLAKAKVVLRGPSLNDPPTLLDINADGSFTTGETLMAGSYQVELPVNDDDVAAGLATAGVAFVGESMVVTVEAGGTETVNFPFRITMQTVATGARMGGGGAYGAPVEGVKLALYARADGTDMLDEATTNEMGMATFNFARDDNTGPAGNDNIVFVKVMESGHDALLVSGNEFVEIQYASPARLYAADHEKEVATLINVAVAFDFWVKSNEMARDGDEGLGGWSTQVYMGDPEDEDNEPLMMPDPDDPMEMIGVTMPTDTTKGDNLGKSTFATLVDPMALAAAAEDGGVTFTVMATPVEEDEDGDRTSEQPDMGEMWEQGDPLTYTHTGLELPPGKDDDMLDLGPIRITFTTQAVYVGVHRELDDRTGFTDFIGVGDGDARPEEDGSAVGEIEVTLMVADSRGRLRPFEYDHDFDDETDDIEATDTFDDSGMVSFAHIPSDTEFTVVVDAPNDMMIVPDDRATKEIDAFGDQLDDYPDGKIVGAFGDMSGARPDVWLCPLQRQEDDDPNMVCSTFAYKWATATVSGAIEGLREDDEAMVTLIPVNSNEDYEDDLADDMEITAGEDGEAEYSFTGVADGRYTVMLEANDGSWEEDEAKGIEVMHDEENDDEDYTGQVSSGNDLSATDLRGVIRGRIANDVNRNGSLTSDESRSGVMVALYTAKKVGGRGTTKNNYVADKPVTDDDDDPVMAETDGDGVFMFEGLVVDDSYFVKPEGTDLYVAVRNGNPKIGRTAEKATDVVPHALVEAGLPPEEDTEPDIPTWDYHTSTADVGAADFVLLYKNGEVEGKVSDPSVRAAHKRSVVELHLCKTSNQVLDDQDPPQVTTPATGCDDFADEDPVEATVDDKGNWEAEDLREGYYEVVVDLPAGYINVSETGTTTTTDAGFTSQQFVELKGGRADASTDPFHIKDRNAGAEAVLTSVQVNGDPCNTGAAATNTENQCGHAADGEISVEVVVSDGATVRLSNSATNSRISTSTMRSLAVDTEDGTEFTLAKPGTERFYVHVAAEDGYSTNTAADAGFNVRRDADVRVKEVTILWSGDRIELDRDALNLDPDGETDPVTGTTTLRVTVDKGDNNGDIPITDLSVTAMSMTTGFGVVSWGTVDVTASPIACSAAFDGLTVGDGTLTLPANTSTTKGSDGVCFRIVDTDGDATDADANANNTRDYILIVTRR